MNHSHMLLVNLCPIHFTLNFKAWFCNQKLSFQHMKKGITWVIPILQHLMLRHTGVKKRF